MEKIYEDQTLQECYEAGFDAGKNGGSGRNSDYHFFTSPDRTEAWEKGNKKAKLKSISHPKETNHSQKIIRKAVILKKGMVDYILNGDSNVQTAEDKIDELINEFIKKWVPQHYPHLVDTDENDGEELRDNLKDLFSLKEQESEKKLKISKQNFDDLYNSCKEEKERQDKLYTERIEQAKQELDDLQGAYDIAMREINRLRDKLEKAKQDILRQVEVEITKFDIEKEFENYKGTRTEFVKMGFRLALNKVSILLNDILKEIK